MASYVDNISSKLREKLSASDLLSQSAVGRSVLQKICPPDAVRLSLAPLTGLCTYKLLDDLRFGSGQNVEWKPEEPAVTISNWFGRLRDSVSEHGEGGGGQREAWSESLARERLRSHQWTHMGEELAALDRATRVPRDAPEVKQIYNAAKALAQYTVEMFALKQGVQFELVPIGSFGTEAKLIDIDEFDFLLIYDQNQKNANLIRDMAIFNKLSDGENRCLMAMGCLPREPSIIGYGNHGPAACTEIGWSCEHGHNHVISVDCSLARRDISMLKNDYLMMSEESALFHDLIGASIAEGKGVVNVNNRLSDVLIDISIMQTLGNENPRFIMAYRLLKVFNRALLPYFAELRGDVHSPAISSHKLKQLLYRQISRDAEAESWNVHNLPQKLATMLEEVCENPDWKTLFSFEAGIHGTSKHVDLKHSLHKQRWSSYKICVQQLVDLLREKTYTQHHHEKLPTIKSPKHKYLAFDKHAFHILDEDREIRSFTCLAAQDPVIPLSNPPMLFSTHPLIQWCQAKIYELYLNQPGMDMSTMDTDELKIGLITDRVNASLSVTIDGNGLMERFKVFACSINVSVYSDFVNALVSCIPISDAFSALFEDHPDQIWDAWSEICDLLPRLESRERSLMQHWCHRVVSTISQPGIHSDNPPLVDQHVDNPLHLYNGEDISDELRRLLECLDYVCVTISRHMRVTYSDPRIPCHVLLWILLNYCLNDNMNYFQSVTSEHIKWKDTTVANKSTRNLHMQPNDRRGCNVIRMGRNGQGLLRSIAVIYSDFLLLASRSVTGLCHEKTLIPIEDFFVDHSRTQMLNLYIATLSSGEKINPTYIALIKSGLLRLNNLWPKCGLLDVAATSYMTQRQIDLFIKDDKKSRSVMNTVESRNFGAKTIQGYIRILSFPKSLFSDKTPVSLLTDKSKRGNFDLMMFPDSPTLFREDVPKINSVGQITTWSQTANQEQITTNTVSFKQILDDSDILEETTFLYQI